MGLSANHSPGEPFALCWANAKGWIAFRDPETGRWDEVWHRDMPEWRRILVGIYGEHRRVRHHDFSDDDALHIDRFRCSCGQEHLSCSFGIGLHCLKGTACLNPHHRHRADEALQG